MLSKADKKWIKDTFSELITKALTVEVMMERRRDPETGVPLKTPQVSNKKVYLPDHWVEFLPFYEQAIVGMQETGDHAKNRAIEARDATTALAEKMDAIGDLYVALERPLKMLASFSDVLNKNELAWRPDQNPELKLVNDAGDPD